ncbi:Zn-ribbon domain-containing OB-fold protein [Sciscionella marina]|uniref:Zn-ribbon domain-containing OB-fold protein n=1 Tax=Sciscionella marina TaxID=508770 RepID=UPI0003A5D2B6|nr:OB-fold nucleic acid binding domain-containing protein [Sciscionella marina]
MTAQATVLSAPLEPGFDYTRSYGPLLGRFAAGLRACRILGARGADGKVHVPAVEYDPETAAALSELVPVSPTGTVRTWSWQSAPLSGQPLEQPFAWALIQLDGADTAMLHAVEAPGPEAMRTGMRVHARWAAERRGAITDIACFVPGEGPDERGELPEVPDAVEEMLTSPIHLSYMHSASPQESTYLRELAEGRVVGMRCPVCRKVYVPPRGACPVDGVPTEEEVELGDNATITTFCVVNVPFPGQRIKPPYVCAYILLDGADIPFLHIVLGCAASEVRMGMRVRAAWKPREEWTTNLANIDHFTPNGEPDAPFESYAHHL